VPPPSIGFELAPEEAVPTAEPEFSRYVERAQELSAILFHDRDQFYQDQAAGRACR